MLPALTLPALKATAKIFAGQLRLKDIPKLYGVTDGKAVGTFVEVQFRQFLKEQFQFTGGNGANGLDFPDLDVDIKVTSIMQPQSSSPYTDASQKVYGLGYHLLVFVYQKTDDPASHAARLEILHVLFIERARTADWQTTKGIRDILDRNGNIDDIIAFLEERNLPLDEIGRKALAERILQERPVLGYLTISNALQWRLQYGRAMTVAGIEDGVENLSIESIG